MAFNPIQFYLIWLDAFLAGTQVWNNLSVWSGMELEMDDKGEIPMRQNQLHCKNKNMDFPYIETAKKC